MDASDRFTEAFAIDDHGEWIESWRIPTKQEALRDGLVRARTQLINQVRGFAKSLGCVNA